MRILLVKWLSALLIAALLLCSVALMEEVVAETMQEAVEETVEEVSTDFVLNGEVVSGFSEEADASEEVTSEAVDEDVAEETDVELDDQSLHEVGDESEVLDLVPLVSNDGEYEEISVPLMAASTSSFDVLSNGTTFNIQGKSISASLVSNQYNCWTYASLMYQKIWGASFSSDFIGTASAGYNSLKQLSDANRTLTVDHLKTYVGNAQLGASLRICGCTTACSSWGNDGLACGHKGHNVIIVAKDANGFTTVENAYPAGQSSYAVCTRYYTWQGFVNWWGNYGCAYIKYIKWPNAPVYDGSVVSDDSFLTDPIIYNAEYYRNEHSDLKEIFKNDDAGLLNHWLTCGYKEGRAASPIFYARYYVSKYSDLSKAFGSDYAAAIRHFLNSGVKEGRTAHEEFSVDVYKKNYEDLQNNYGSDNYKYCLHYVNHGRAEGRIANKRLQLRFDPNGGTVSPTYKDVTSFAILGELPVPYLNNNIFLGWYTKLNGGALVTASSVIDYRQTPVLYAHWQKITPTSTQTPTTKPTATPIPTQTSAPTPAPTSVSVPTAISSVIFVPRNTKATVIAGKNYQIDLAGKTGSSFKSSNKKVAVVDRNGLVTAKAAGKAKITVKIGKKKRTVTLTVKDPTIPTSIALNLSGIVSAKQGESVALSVTLPKGTASGIKWKSSNKKVATVSNGVVTFKKPGRVTITATATRGKKKARVKFKVSK